tara:strand:- start:666 stop:1328 length:663 start_codon:yes stop_codon:yes gene_type:complete
VIKHAAETTQIITLRNAVGGAVTTKAKNAAEIATLLNAHVNAHNSELSASQTDGVFRIQSSGSSFIYAKNNAFMVDFLALPESAAGVTTMTGTKSPAVFLGSNPAVVTAGARWLTRRGSPFRGQGVALKVMRQNLWRVEMTIEADEIEAWRPVARLMQEGSPFSIYLDQANPATAWSYANPTKNILGAVLDDKVTNFPESQISEPYQSAIRVSFTCVEYS